MSGSVRDLARLTIEQLNAMANSGVWRDVERAINEINRRRTQPTPTQPTPRQAEAPRPPPPAAQPTPPQANAPRPPLTEQEQLLLRRMQAEAPAPVAPATSPRVTRQQAEAFVPPPEQDARAQRLSRNRALNAVIGGVPTLGLGATPFLAPTPSQEAQAGLPTAPPPEAAPEAPAVAPAEPAAPEAPPAAPVDPATQYLMDVLAGRRGGGGGGGFRPTQITPDMLPDWQLVRDAMAAAAPEAPETTSDDERRRRVLMQFLGNFSWRPGERIGSSLARQGGASVAERLGVDDRNRQTRDVFRREQQEHRRAMAQTEAQAQVGQSQALINMITANNAMQAQAAQLAAAGGGRQMQAALALLGRQGQGIPPQYLYSRMLQAATDLANPLMLPGLDRATAEQQALAIIRDPQNRQFEQLRNALGTSQGALPLIDPRLQGQYRELLSTLLSEQFRQLPPAQQQALLNQFAPLATNRPRAGSGVGE